MDTTSKRTVSQIATQVKEWELTVLAKSSLMEILHDQVKNRSIEPTRIVDHYVAGADGVARMKLRDLRHEGKGGQSLLVVKEPIANESAGHWLKTTIVLSGNQSMAIRSGSCDYAPNLVVFKDRYKIDLAGHAARVYVYLSDLRGLVTVSFKGLPNAKARADLRSELSGSYATGELAKLCIDPEEYGSDFNGCRLAGERYKNLEFMLQGLGYQRLDPAKFGLRAK